ncbi:serine/threonine-protein kinase [Nonomuraea sp. NBC_01738]|uniref:serine/threonine-protein kinase n=1 Tax=Nonomuraea sp. NBC_01738 TaxID=2976003 RepID=UPI002E129171|nr:serine/threonine-protein kinase [Nonomuraea sp. NBC_01738]
MVLTPLEAADPQRIDGYLLAGRLGAGGQGVVYEGYDESGGRVAIKLLHGLSDRTAREVEAARRVASFCTAKILGAELGGERSYIVSEYVEGLSLRRSVAASGPLDGGALHRLAAAMATALAAIHAAGVVHRDLKPDNVLIGPDGPRVIDFGIARTEEMTLTASGPLVGTPTYMAPEALSGERAGRPADVFAWGAVMLFAATGEDPFRASSVGAVLHRVLSADPDVSVLPPGLRALVETALSKDPRSRPTARDLLLGLVGEAGHDVTERPREPYGTAGGPIDSAPDGSLGALAESVYAALDERAREGVPAVLLRLVSADQDTGEVLRRADRAEFPAEAEVLTAFSTAGLLQSDHASVRLAHPALLRAWPRFREWIEAERPGLAIHHQLAASARRWETGGRRDADLHHGSQLEAALQWAATGRRHLTLTSQEKAFLDGGASLARRQSRRRRVLTGALVVLLVVAAGALVFADQQRRTVQEQQAAAITQRDKAAARAVAARAEALRGSDPRTALRLSVAAWRIAPVSEAKAALLGALGQRERSLFQAAGANGLVRALSQDGRTALTAERNTVRAYDVESGAKRAEFAVPGKAVAAVAGSADGRVVLVVDEDGVLSLWDPAAGRRTTSFRTGESTSVVAFAGTGDRYVLVGSDLWDTRTGKRAKSSVPSELDGGPPVYAVSGDGGRAFSQSEPWGGLTVWEPGTGAIVTTFKVPSKASPRSYSGDPVILVAPSPDGKVAAVSAEPGVVRMWDVATGRRRGPAMAFTGELRDLRMSRDGRFVAVAAEYDLWLFRAADGAPLLHHRLSSEKATEVAFGPGNATLAVRAGERWMAIDVRDRTGAHVPREGFTSAAFAPDGRTLVTLAISEKVKWNEGVAGFWDTASLRRVRSVVGPWKGFANFENYAFDTAEDWAPDHMRRLAFSPDGSLLALGGAELALLRVADGTLSVLGKVRTAEGDYNALEFGVDGRTLVVDHNGTTETWDVATRRRLPAAAAPAPGADGYNEAVWSLGVSPDGRLRVTGAEDGSVRLWPVAGTQVSGAQVATAGEGLTADLPMRGHTGLPTRAAFSRDGSLLATGGHDGTVRLWEVATRRQLAAFTTGDDVLAVSFTPAGELLAFGRDGVVRRTGLDPERVAGEVCAVAGGGPTAAEWRAHIADVPFRDVCRAS